MHRLIISCFIILSSLFGVAQTRDSLISVWENESLPDSSRLKAISTLNFRFILKSSPDSSALLAKEHLELAIRSGMKLHQADAKLLLGYASRDMGKYKDALQVTSEALELYQELRDSSRILRAINNLGITYKRVGDTKLAREHFYKGLRLSKSFGDKKKYVHFLNNIGVTHSVMGNSDSALAIYRNVVALRKSMNEESENDATYNNIAQIYMVRQQFDSATKYYDLSLRLREEQNDLVAIASSLYSHGTLNHNQRNYLKAIDYYNRSKSLYEQQGNKVGVAQCLTRLSWCHRELLDFSTATDLLLRSVSILEKTESRTYLGRAYMALGSLNMETGQFNQAEKYYQKGVKIAELADDLHLLATISVSYGSLLSEMKRYNDAVDLYKNTLNQMTNYANPNVRASLITNLADVYMKMGDYALADPLIDSAQHIFERISNKSGIATTIFTRGEWCFEKGLYRQAIQHEKKALELFQEEEDQSKIKEVVFSLYRAYKALGEMGKSLQMHERYLALSDTLDKSEVRDKLSSFRIAAKLKQEHYQDSIEAAKKLELKDAQLQARNARVRQQELRSQKKTQQTYFLIGGLTIVLVLSGIIFRRLSVSKQQNKIIRKQREQVTQAFHQLEEKNKEVLDSIQYAKRIQSATLPPVSALHEAFPDSFVLYLPKDIVAGDFYWMESFASTSAKATGGTRKASDSEGRSLSRVEGRSLSRVEGWTYIAVADCTGHGVPGAMVSVVCSNALSKALVEEGITETGKLLDRTRELVIERFGKSDSEIHDGMDISLCAIQHDRSEVMWSGANNPLWIVKRGKAQTELEELLHELKPDKQPIGKYSNSTPFSTHRITLDPGDTLYMFSDGYQDQFGGPKGKKFKPANMKKLLISNREKSLKEQKNALHREFQRWKGNLEQIDDVCIIGIKV